MKAGLSARQVERVQQRGLETGLLVKCPYCPQIKAVGSAYQMHLRLAHGIRKPHRRG